MKILREGDRGYALAPERGRVEIVYEYRTVELEKSKATVGNVLVGVMDTENRRGSDGAGPIDAETESSERGEDVLDDRARKRQRQLGIGRVADHIDNLGRNLFHRMCRGAARHPVGQRR